MALEKWYKKAIVDRYTQYYEKHGYHFKSVGWGNWETQHLRFQILSEVGDLRKTEVVDLGCGFGDLYGFLKEKFGEIKYSGIDLVEDFIREGQKRHPDADFLVQDILEDGFEKCADFYLISGALNSKIADNLNYSEEIISKTFSMSRRGMAVNFLSKYVDYETGFAYHHSPEQVFAFAKTLTKYVTLRHDYPLWEFTVYLYKKDYIEGGREG